MLIDYDSIETRKVNHMNNRKVLYSLRSVMGAAAMLLCVVCFAMIASTESHAATLTKFADAPSSNLVTDPDKYYAVQGTAFDTYSGIDGYTFAISKISSKNGAVKLTHYTQNSTGISQTKSVVYSKAQVGHANDATIYKKGNVTYLFVARGGKGNKTAAMIKLSDFNNGVAKVYPVKFKKLDTKSGKDLRGISYVGKKKVKVGKKKVKKDVFVVEVGRRMNLVYLKSLKGNKAVFVKVDSQRFSAPKIGSRECTAQGVTYHNGNLYIPWGDEGSGGNNKTGKVTSISYSKLFKGSKPNKAKKLTVIWSETRGNDFTPETVYFTNLNGKLPMFLSCNYGLDGGRDEINKSDQIF